MAEVAGLALAANIMQFVEVGGKAIRQLNKYYTAGRDSKDLIPDISAINKDLTLCLHHLESNARGEAAAEDRSLQLLAQNCSEVAHELQSKLDAITPRRRSKREAAAKAVKALWTDDEIKTLQQRLDNYCSQITMHLLVDIR